MLQVHPKKSTSVRRPSRPFSRWVTARKIVQGITLLVFIVLFIQARHGGWPAVLTNLPMRLDPLAVLLHLISSRTILAGSALALIVVAITLLAGRAWCGWLCPLGTVLDLFPLYRASKNQPKLSENWRAVKYAVLLVLLVAAFFGNLTLLVLDPLTIVFRTLSTAIWPALDRVVTAVETTLYNLPGLGDSISTVDTWVRPALFPAAPAFYRDAWLFAFVFFGVIALNIFAPRFWCRYLCPLGGLLGLLSKFAFFRRKVLVQDCKSCALCERSCPTGTINPAKNFASDPGECTLCLECLPACPRSSISFATELKPAAWETYDPGRRAVLGAFITSAFGVALFQSDKAAKRDDAHLLRPPGSLENDLINKCIRCAECIRACPTNAIQPAAFEAGLEGLWTPLLMMRLGYCDYACSACGQACPVQAIPPLTLEEKRTQVIGAAYIDQNRCIAWADHTDCIVCEEMCPISEKAIQLKETEIALVDGSSVTVKLPVVLRERCIGCGICEYKCPVNGEAAIRIFVPTTALPF